MRFVLAVLVLCGSAAFAAELDSGTVEDADAGAASGASEPTSTSLSPLDGGTLETRLQDGGGQGEPLADDAPAVDAGAPPNLLPPESVVAVDTAPDAGTRETVIFGRRETETSGSVHVIKGSDLERFERDDPHAMLRNGAPGIYVREEDGFGLRPNIGLRGANSDRSKKVTLLEDGVLLGPAPYSAPAAYYFPVITRMQSVRVVKGPSAITQGPQTVGGSIEFITRDAPRAGTFFIDLAGGEYLYGKAHGRFGFGDERTGVLIEGVHLRNDGFKEIDGGGNTGFVKNEWMAKGRHKLDDHNTFTLKAGYSTEGSDETYLGLTDEDLRANPNRRYRASLFDHMQWVRTQIALTHAFTFEKLNVTSTVYRNDFDRTWRKVNRFRGEAIAPVLEDPTSARHAVYYALLTGDADTSVDAEELMIGPNHRVFVSQGIQTVATLDTTTGPLRHKLEAGARWHYDRIRRNHTEDAYQLQGGEPVWAGEPTLTTVDDRDSTHAVALHVADAILYGPLALTPGVRTELIRSRSINYLTGSDTSGAVNVVLPGIGLHGAITETVGAFAGVYRGFSPPPPGAGDTQPEASVNYEAGARWTPGGARLEAIGFFNDYSNLTNLCTFSSGCVNENLDQQFSAGRAYIWGLEVYGSKTFRPLAGTRVPVQLAYTFTQTMLRDTFKSADPQFGNVQAGDELPYVPAHQLAANAGIERELYGFNLAATYTGVMREEAGQGETDANELTDPLLTWDVNASYRPTRDARIYLNVKNVFDAQGIVSRRPFGARTNAPRMIQVGFSYGF